MLPEISKICPDSTCVISAWRKGQIFAGSLKHCFIHYCFSIFLFYVVVKRATSLSILIALGSTKKARKNLFKNSEYLTKIDYAELFFQ